PASASPSPGRHGSRNGWCRVRRGIRSCRELWHRLPPAGVTETSGPGTGCPSWRRRRTLPRPPPRPAQKEPPMSQTPDHRAMLAIAVEEARQGLAEGGIPIGAALFAADGTLLGRGHNRRVQENDPSVHGETDAFRKAGRQRSYRDTIMVTTLSPCWYCSGLVRQFGIGTVVMGEAVNF